MRGFRLALTLVLLLLPAPLLAQTVSGRVADAAGAPLAGVRVEERGTFNTATSDARGEYRIETRVATPVLRFSLLGFQPLERDAVAGAPLDVTLLGGVAVEGVLVVGTRRQDRSALETPAPVDVVYLPQTVRASGQLDLNQLLQQVIPSFNASRQSGADGSDHVDPASLRGLGPDQTLVLVNGKRRHQSSLINIFGSRGRGNTGTDLNAIPMSAVERIEVLRDGASALYGSDAIAGVVNVVLKSNTGSFTGSVASGVNSARPPSGAAVLREDRFDGAQTQVGANYGIAVGRGGFLNLTAEAVTRDHTNRPVDPAEYDIYRRQFGDAALSGVTGFLNGRLPLSDRAAAYLFGGYGRRATDAFAWTREPDSDRNVPALYPNGFDPVITSDIDDASLSAGVAARLGGWDLDLNDTFGFNRFHYGVEETLNASLLERSPTRFDAGGFQLAQNTTGLVATRFHPTVLSGLNLALGGEVRLERYQIFAGEEGSYRNYGVRERVVDGRVVREDTLGRPGGSQGFPGFQPANELSETRSNVGAFLDAELDLTPALMVGGAARYERYSDFGSTVTGRVASRLRLSHALALRGSASTGFRAPSLAQVYFNSTFTDVVAGDALDKLIARNDSEIARALGIPPLQEERSVNFGAGFTARLGDFTATVDGYLVDVDDRVVITGAFEQSDDVVGPELEALGLGGVQFFTNALDTRTRGLDVVLGWGRQLGRHSLRAALAGNFNEMELDSVRVSSRLQGKEDVYFGPRDRYFLLASAPSSKIALSLDHALGALDTHLRVVRYGEVVLLDWTDAEDVYRPRATVDLSLGYTLSDRLGITLGAANLLNTYPTNQDPETETGGLWDAVQMGSNGAFYFVRLNVTR